MKVFRRLMAAGSVSSRTGHPFSGKRVEKALGEEDFDFLFPQTPIT